MVSFAKLRRPKSTSNIHPWLAVKDETLKYTIGDAGWSLPLADIVCIAEYTTDAGPFADDYFLVFGTRSDAWYEASVYCEGRDEVLTILSRYMGHPMQFGLCNSADYASRIIWPVELTDQPLIDTKSKTLNSALKSMLAKGEKGAMDAI